MKIHKVLNNNFVIILDEKGKEQIIGGKGIAFGKRVGDVIDINVINKTFVVPQIKEQEIIQKFIKDIPIEFFEISLQTIEIAKVKISNSLNENVCLAISDHLYSVVKRYEGGYQVPNYMVLEVKKFYPTKFEVGIHALDLVNKQFNIKLSEDEAGFIATHIIDSELETSNLEQVYETATLIKDISNIVKYYFNVEFDNDSIYNYRFITHLKFFAKRLFHDYTFKQIEDNHLYDIIKKTYINSFDEADLK